MHVVLYWKQWELWQLLVLNPGCLCPSWLHMKTAFHAWVSFPSIQCLMIPTSRMVWELNEALEVQHNLGLMPYGVLIFSSASANSANINITNSCLILCPQCSYWPNWSHSTISSHLEDLWNNDCFPILWKGKLRFTKASPHSQDPHPPISAMSAKPWDDIIVYFLLYASSRKPPRVLVLWLKCLRNNLNKELAFAVVVGEGWYTGLFW